MKLKVRILSYFTAVIFIVGFLVALLGFYLIKSNIIERAQRKLNNDLNFARSLYNGEIDRIKEAFGLIVGHPQINSIKDKIGLDYLYVIDKNSIPASLKSEILRKSVEGKEPIGGSRVIDSAELLSIGNSLYNKSRIDVIPTLKSRPVVNHVLDKAMAIEYAMPLKDKTGNFNNIIYGGKIINRDFSLVDRIHNYIFEDKLYGSKPLGTVTIFLDDIRIATNVLDRQGKRAIGTKVSDKVYEQVFGQKRSWIDKAFVVTDWYFTAYEPIKDIKGNVIGMLYVGMLEKPFADIMRNVFLILLAIIGAAMIFAFFLSIMLAGKISRPITAVVDGASKMSSGDFSYRVEETGSIDELDNLAVSFNNMARSLMQRDNDLNVSNDKLSKLNKSYLDLIGFVAHELKGILSSAVLNAYSVRDGFLGMINFKQRKALDSVTRSLDYLTQTVKNFLNLSRIEKEELVVNKKEILLKEDVFDASIEAFTKSASEKGLEIINNIEPGLRAVADSDLLQIVANNLISNAVKYAVNNTKITVDSAQDAGYLQVRVYSQGNIISKEDAQKLFKRFSRLDAQYSKKSQGTGLGLFISREIIRKHGGDIRLETCENGNSFIFKLERGMQS